MCAGGSGGSCWPGSLVILYLENWPLSRGLGAEPGTLILSLTWRYLGVILEFGISF